MSQDWTAKIDKLKSLDNLTLGPNRFLKPEINVRPYQVLGAVLLYHCKNFLLADACGLGKTLQTLLAYAMRKERDLQTGRTPTTRLLVVTEKSAVLQWVDEVENFFTGITAHPVPAGKKKKPFDTPRAWRQNIYDNSDADIFTMAHKTFTLDWRAGCFNSLIKDCILVLDEADLIRTKETQIFKAFKEAELVCRGFKQLTATPIYTRLEDYYNLINILNPYIFGSREVFIKKYCITTKVPVPSPNGGFWYKDKVEGYHSLDKFHHEARHFMILRSPEDVGAELPEIIDKPVYLDMGTKQTKLYAKAAASEFNVLPGAEIPRKNKKDEDGNPRLETYEEVYERLERTAESKLVTTGRELQVATMPQLVGEDAPSVKYERLLQLLQGDLLNQKVVVFSQFKACVNILEERLEAEGIACLRVTGDQSSDQRDKAKKKFSEEGSPYVMLVTSAGKKAINLQVAGTFIFFDQPLAWGDGYQLIGRVRRMGSKYSHVLVIRLMARNTADEWVYKILSQEDDLVKKCLQVRGTMQVSPELLSYVIQKVREGKKVEEAMEDYVSRGEE